MSDVVVPLMGGCRTAEWGVKELAAGSCWGPPSPGVLVILTDDTTNVKVEGYYNGTLYNFDASGVVPAVYVDANNKTRVCNHDTSNAHYIWYVVIKCATG